MTCLFSIADTTTADDLVMEGAKGSVAAVLAF